MKAVLRKQNPEKYYNLIKKQIEEADTLLPDSRKKLFDFCVESGITDILNVGYNDRQGYKEYIFSTNIKRKTQYVNDMDRVVMLHRKRKNIKPANEAAFEYRRDEVIYLPYAARVDKLDILYCTQDKENLVWDFSYDFPKEYKRQISQALNFLIEEMNEGCDLRQKRRHMVTLKFLYEFLPKHGIYDLMAIDSACENRFEIYTTEKQRCLRVCAKPLINICRKVTFMESEEVNWNAYVWYLDRFIFDEARVNESEKVRKVSYLAILNKENRQALQNYTKYLLGLTDMSISTIRSTEYRLEEFVLYIGNKSIYEVCAEDIDGYIEAELKRGSRKQYIDRKLILIDQWYRYLLSCKVIDKLPFMLEYYVNLKYADRHNDRSVEYQVINLILQKLKHCDEKLRLIFLLQLCTGRRISEVCQIKARNFKEDDGDYWICFYQPKMHEDIMVPIPSRLFCICQNYIKEKDIRNNEYVFQSEKGGIYRSSRYQKGMAKFVESIGISEDEYDFRSHDFRHTIATYLYDNGASIQVIRDFLGHKSDEMTKQYIDFIPKEIEKRSRKLFKENPLIGEEKNG